MRTHPTPGLEPQGPRLPRLDGPAPLDPAALRLLQSLPVDLRMVRTRRDFPHVLNRLAAVWHDPAAFGTAMRSLLVDERGTRQGFPFAVIDELIDLHGHYGLDPGCFGLDDRR